MLIPEAFRKTRRHRALWATMGFLADRDPAGPVGHPGRPRHLHKRAAGRRRDIQEHRAADHLRDYFRSEREHVAAAVRSGGDPGRAVDAMREDLLDVYGRVLRVAGVEFGTWAETHLPRRKSVRKAGADWLLGPLMEWLGTYAAKQVTRVSDETKQRIRAALSEGREAGEGVDALAGRIDDLYLDEIIPNRSMVIARTEVGNAAGFAQHVAARDADVPMEKEWMSLADARVRDDHADADGQRVPLDEPFTVGGDELMWPGDTMLGAGPDETINCRCSVLYHVVDDGGEEKRKAGYDPSQQRDESGRWSETGADFLARIAEDPEVQAVREHIRTSPKTVDKYRRPDGTYTPERAALHEAIVRDMDTGKAPASGKPTLSLILGLPASGKSKQIRPLIRLLGESTVVDPDAVKDRLPEYAEGNVQADSVHVESADVSVQLLHHAADNGHNVVLDVTGKNYEQTLKTVRGFVERGYAVDVYHVTIPPIKAAARALTRFKEERRFVDPFYILEEVGNRSDTTYEGLKQTGLLRSWRSYDNDVPKGTPARLREAGRT